MPAFTALLSTEFNPELHVDNIYLPYLDHLKEHNLIRASTVAQARSNLRNRIWNEMYRRIYLGQNNWDVERRDPESYRRDMAKWRHDDNTNNEGATTRMVNRFMHLFVHTLIPTSASVAFVEALELDRAQPNPQQERTIRNLPVNNAETYERAARELFKHWRDVINQHRMWNPSRVGYVNSSLQLAEEYTSHIRGESPVACNLNNVFRHDVVVLAHLRSNDFVQIFQVKLRGANPDCVLITE